MIALGILYYTYYTRITKQSVYSYSAEKNVVGKLLLHTYSLEQNSHSVKPGKKHNRERQSRHGNCFVKIKLLEVLCLNCDTALPILVPPLPGFCGIFVWLLVRVSTRNSTHTLLTQQES